jgi:hypothetical protein
MADVEAKKDMDVAQPGPGPVHEVAAPGKPGFKTTEFWLTAIVTLAGLVAASGLPSESPAVKIAGLAVSVLSALGYTVVRGGVKKAASVIVIAVLLGGAAGCCSGHVSADAIEGTVEKVTQRHDRFVKGEATAEDKDPKNKDTFLRSTELLRTAVKEAKSK